MSNNAVIVIYCCCCAAAVNVVNLHLFVTDSRWRHHLRIMLTISMHIIPWHNNQQYTVSVNVTCVLQRQIKCIFCVLSARPRFGPVGHDLSRDARNDMGGLLSGDVHCTLLVVTNIAHWVHAPCTLILLATTRCDKNSNNFMSDRCFFQ